jgi:hypothetical protein
MFGGLGIVVHLGSNIANTGRVDSGYAFPLVIDGLGVITLSRDGENLLLSFLMMDNKDIVSCAIVENELRVFPTAWDIEYDGHTVIIRNGPRDIILEMTFEQSKSVLTEPSKIIISRMKLHVTRGIIEVQRDGKMRIYGRAIGNSTMMECQVLGAIGFNFGGRMAGNEDFSVPIGPGGGFMMGETDVPAWKPKGGKFDEIIQEFMMSRYLYLGSEYSSRNSLEQKIKSLRK